MSRVGKSPIKIEEGIQVTIEKGGQFNHIKVRVKGPKGELAQDVRKGIEVEVQGQEIIVKRTSELKTVRSLHGLYRSLIANMVIGVKEEFIKELEIVGVGFRANTNGNNLELSLGLTHPVLIPIPDGLKVDIKDKTDLKISGIDKEKVGHFAAKIREIKKPEPYKGKGIRYKGEYVRRKAGKAAISTKE
ncbi:MAG: 50S ribosomal protein L6 [candidate division WS6 bacterium GW2011_GWA2_37_6]|uniref:Large ribosomal subunit protein uL6 n=1 Tax=candidate division WS6 bacterium GW2011_GWA2_37_6 TaxID=1619087 RepID=A0A0G0K5J2_9BACT|nr:MAG: 50S ribosomal protein L6 [candidate division WS6 bacterium GW2011_GWA2_37_6]